MYLDQLQNLIQTKEAKIGVVGLGYVGLPLAASFACSGFEVIGIDIKIQRINEINQGINPIKGNEPGLDDLITRTIRSKQLRCSTLYSELSDRDIIFVNVETPIDLKNKPINKQICSALSSICEVMKEGVLIIIESTIAPGTMNEIVMPLLTNLSGKELDKGFFLGYCPERVMPGKLLQNIREQARVVGAENKKTGNTIVQLYKHIVYAEIDQSNWITAELVKTAENAYRDVQIAFANEIALICEKVGADVWNVRDLVNKSPSRFMHFPGTGVGGHCIPKDPWLLLSSVEDEQIKNGLIAKARKLNDQMPKNIFSLLCDQYLIFSLDISKTKTCVLGYAYLENSDDSRNSPTEALIREMKKQHLDYVIHDPFIEKYSGDVYDMAIGCDAVVIMTGHDQYKELNFHKLKESLRTQILIDGRNVFDDQSECDGMTVIKLGRS